MLCFQSCDILEMAKYKDGRKISDKQRLGQERRKNGINEHGIYFNGGKAILYDTINVDT